MEQAERLRSGAESTNVGHHFSYLALYIQSDFLGGDNVVPHCGELLFKQYKEKLEVDHRSPLWGTIITAQKVRLYRKSSPNMYSLTFRAGIMWFPIVGKLWSSNTRKT